MSVVKQPESQNDYVRLTRRTLTLLALSIITGAFMVALVMVVAYRAYNDERFDRINAERQVSALTSQITCFEILRERIDTTSGHLILVDSEAKEATLALVEGITKYPPGDPQRTAVLQEVIDSLPQIRQDIADARTKFRQALADRDNTQALCSPQERGK